MISLSPRALLLLQTVLVVGPALAAVRVGAAEAGAQWLFASLCGLLALQALFGHGIAPLALLVAVLPAVMLLRSLVLYNSVVVLFVAAIGVLLVRSPVDRRLLARPLGLVATALCLCYWGASFAATGDYSSNLRVFELLFGATGLVLLARYREHLAGALLGMLGTLAGIGIGLAVGGTRLGYLRSAEVSLGNPIAFGLPVAFLLTVLLADSGRWFRLERHRALRLALSGLAGMLLVISASRGSWLVAIATIGILLLLGQRHRRTVAAAIAVVTLGTAVLLQSQRGEELREWVDRTVSSDRSLSNRTSGRTDQWLLFPLVVSEMPVLGFGPGRGAGVYAEYSLRDSRVRLAPGQPIQWHSLYQHVTVETGLIGAVVLIGLVLTLVSGGLRYLRRHASPAPLACALGFLCVGASVSTMDAASALFLGFALLPRFPPARRG